MSWSFYAKGTKKAIQKRLEAWKPEDGMEADTAKHAKDLISAVMFSAQDSALFDVIANGHMQDTQKSAQIVNVTVTPIHGFEFDPDETPPEADYVIAAKAEETVNA